MTCRGFQYAEGGTYKLPEGETPKLCENGFHACEAPIDCLRYYAPADSVYHEVELDGVTDETADDDSKRVGSKIKIGARLDIAGIVKAQFEYAKEHYKDKQTSGYRGVSSSGDSGVSSSRGSAETGKNGIACVRGNGVKARGELGAVLVIAVENESDYDLREWKAGVVDGETLKPGVWYGLKDGEFAEIE